MKFKYLPLVFVLAFGLVLFFQTKVIAAPEDVVTICHANGNGSFIRIVTSENAIGGHFENSGTPKQGHEDDILIEGEGQCPGDSISPTPTPTNDPTVTPTVTPATSVIPSVTPTFIPTATLTVTPSIKPTVTTKPSKTPTPTKPPKPSKTPKPTSSPVASGGNVCTIINTVGLTQNTGNNNASQNTGGNTSILSGNANTVIGIGNECGSNYALIGSGGYNTNVNISDNGAGSLNSILVKNVTSLNIVQ